MCRGSLRWLVLLAAASCTPEALTAQHQQALIGGRPAPDDDAVFMVLLDGRDFCSATQLGAHSLLTAAHCVSDAGTLELSNAQYRGSVTSTNRFTPSDVWKHPGYRASDNVNDIALIAVAESLSSSPLPWNEAELQVLAFNGQPVRLVGYGQLGNRTGGGERRQADVTITGFLDGRFRTGTPESGLCFGDSGGPALYRFDGVERVIGVHAHLDSSLICGPGAHTRVDLYRTEVLDFLEAHEPASCRRERKCMAGCTPVDVDCLCAADGRCTTDCPDFDDPDCPATCAPNGVCGDAACPRPDTDCTPVWQPCSDPSECQSRLCLNDPQHPSPYCSTRCASASDCPPDADCVAGGQCIKHQLPTAQPGQPCVVDAIFCERGSVCAAATGVEPHCAMRCVSNAECLGDEQCVASGAQRVCMAMPNVVMPSAPKNWPAARRGCSSGGDALMAWLAVLALRRGRPSLRRSRRFGGQ